MRVRAYVLASFALVACSRTPTPTEHGGPAPQDSAGSPDHGGHESLPHRVSVPEQVVRNAGIKAKPAVKGVLSETLSLPGEVSADPDRLARISSPAAGRLEDVRFREGQLVKKGDVLATVRVPEIAKVRAAYLASTAKAKAARANATRLRSLLEQRLAAEQDVLNAEAEADALELEAQSTATQLGALGAGAAGAFTITLRSPIEGTVVSRDAIVGQPASAEQVLGSVADLSEVWFLARVFEKDLSQLKPGAVAEVHLNAYPNEHFPGTVEYIGQQIDNVARTVTARVRLKNHDALLRLGLFGTCQVSLAGQETAPKLVVDQASVTEVGGKNVVFVQGGPREFELHEVTLGKEALGRVEVLAGLREGEQVVSDGVFTLKSIVLKGSFAEDE